MMLTGVNNDMVKLTVIRPYKIKGEASCERCHLSYPKRDYDILYRAQKLVYFNITINDKTRFICHDCFYKFLKKKSIEIGHEDFCGEIKDANKKFVITVTNRLDDEEDNSDFLL